ncbi:MAG: RusA family crossover junction endodeoxyribonuclease [Calditrichaeota bacterium]|nr:MAG: RusA family crossover junction endodeoxyribonuclease [Calditrichota bacterium]
MLMVFTQEGYSGTLLEITLNELVSKKNNYIVIKQNKHFGNHSRRKCLIPNQRYKQWEENTYKIMLGQTHFKPPEIDRKTYVLFIFPHNLRLDIDNALTGLFECLQKSRIFKNDKYIVPLTTMEKANGTTKVRILIPENRQDKRAILEKLSESYFDNF